MKLANGEASFHLTKSNTIIGAHVRCDIQLPGPNVSVKHAFVRKDGSEYVLTDQGSRNGTFVNGVRLSGEHYLKQDDILNFGGYPLTVHVDDSGSSTVRADNSGTPLKIKDERGLSFREKFSLIRIALDLLGNVFSGKISGAIRSLIMLPFRAVWLALKSIFWLFMSLDDD